MKGSNSNVNGTCRISTVHGTNHLYKKNASNLTKILRYGSGQMEWRHQNYILPTMSGIIVGLGFAAILLLTVSEVGSSS